ncbi:MAG: signal recognition particle protein [Fimbriimonadaceae bacterium]|nr:signal recognition particle protein [Fimbriimonadaceae bacterium]
MLDTLTRRLSGILGGLRAKGRLTESDVADMLREVRVALLEADVNFQVAKQFVATVREKAVGEDVFGSLTADQTIVRLVRDELTEMLGGSAERFRWSPSPPTVVLMCGLQGSGKTTTAAKLAKWMASEGKKAMLAACDVQRPAAVKQLQVLGESIDVPVYAGDAGTQPAKIAQDALARCRHLMLDVLIVDTAGRLTIDEPLMEELKAIRRAVNPTEVLLVLDATAGQEAVNVAEAFHKAVDVTGAIFTKLDGDTRGGAVLSVRAATGVPVRYIGLGEQVDALDVFYPDRMAQRILGMGDILGIIEKAETALDKDDAKALEGKIKSGHLDFTDMLSQFKTMRKMGPIQNVLKMIPGLGAQIPEEALSQLNEGHLSRIEAIILSMTPRERGNPDVINGSRRKRIAAGSGTTVEEVNSLIKQLYEMRKNMKQLGKMQQRMMKRGRRRR